MELILILIVIAIASFVVYFQLKGSRPDVVPVHHLATGGGGKKSPKSVKAAAEPKKVTEDWDKVEVAPKRKVKAATDESPKKKKKERFDPVMEGKKVLKSETLKKRENAAKFEEDKTKDEIVKEKQVRSRLAADGFVVIDEKKPKTKKAAAGEEVAAVVAVDEAPLSEFEERLKRLRDVVQGMRPADKRENGEGGYKGAGGDRRAAAPVVEEEETAEDTAASELSNAEKEKKNRIAKENKIREHLAEIRKSNNTKAPAAAPTQGKRFEMTAKAADATKPVSRGWEKKAAPKPVVEAVAEAVVEDDAEKTTEEAVEAVVEPVAEDEWAENKVECEEF